MPKTLRFLFIRQGLWWTAVCLDVFTSAQGQSLFALRDEIQEAVKDTLNIYAAEGKDWQEHLGGAPKKYEDLFNDKTKTIPFEVYIDQEVARLIGDTPTSEAKLYEDIEDAQALCA